MAAPTMDRWPRIKELFHAALECDAPGRAALLADACGDDASLRSEVESLLASHESDTDYLETPALRVYGDAGEVVCGIPHLGRRIGAYELLEVVASGGMGTVYAAVRADDEYRKRVAVKLIRDPRATGDPVRGRHLLRRFRTERQTLANLDHPSIAKLLDGGTTEDGVPYLVMDYIDGLPIDSYCDERALSISRRLELFHTACSAVQYAHQNLIVHRDLKPANILVTPQGVPKLLDFGIAKLLDPDSAGLSRPLTVTTAPLMTPAYASPEQIRCQPISTATDVYSLGVILYELLTGHRPYPSAHRFPHEMASAICEQEPERPSTVVYRVEHLPEGDDSGAFTLTPQTVSRTREGHPDRLRRRLVGDLDMIVLKALRKEPERRYTSVEQFAEDIRRHLHGLPVIARPDTLTYRVSKFVRRHATGVALSGMTALVLLGATALAARSAGEARRQRDAAALAQREAESSLERAESAESVARAKAQTAETISGFLIDLFEASDPFEGPDSTNSDGSEITIADVLQGGDARIAQLSGEPEIQANLMETLGRVYQNLGLYGDAESHLHESLESRRRVFGDQHLETARSLYQLASLRHDQGDYAAAESLYREALATRRKLLGDEHAQVAESLSGLARSLRKKGAAAEAEESHREALVMRRKLLGNEHLDVAISLNDLALLLQDRRDYDAAESLFRESLDLRRKLLGDEHPFVATGLNNLALLLKTKRDYTTAERMFRDALAMRRKAFGDEHPAVATSLNNLAVLLHDRRDYDGAEPLYRDVLVMRRKLLGDEHPDVALTLHSLGRLLIKKKDPAAAEPMLREALAIGNKKLSPTHRSVLAIRADLGIALTSLQRFEEAETLLLDAVAPLEEQPDYNTNSVRRALIGIVELYDLWHTAKPHLGHDADAAHWRARLGAWQAATQPASASAPPDG